MMNLEGKRVLLIAPLGQYSEAIKDAIEQRGGEVDCFEERPSLSFLVKFLIRYFPKLIQRYIQRYFDYIINTTKNRNYSFVLIIRGEAITKQFILDLKENFNKARLIGFLWDSLRHTKGPLDKLNLFHKVFSFDKIDCENYGLTFSPLFYTDSYKNILFKDNDFKYEFSFIGTIHSERYRFIKQFNHYAKLLNRSVYFFMYLTSYIAFFKMKFIDKSLPKAKISEFQFNVLNKEEVFEVIANSKVVIDAQHPSQVGLTIRTIETLGAQRKLITTNKEIKNYDFYNTNNILVVGTDNIEVPKSFLECPYEQIDIEIYESYSIGSWVERVLNEE